MEIACTGDVMLVRPFGQPMDGDGTPGSSGFALLRGADLVLVNLEVPLTDVGLPWEKPSVLRAPTSVAPELGRMGADACSVATNHALDYGIEGLLSTLAALDGINMPNAGGGKNLDEAMRPALLVGRDGSKVAFFSLCSCLPPGFNATPVRPGIAPLRVGQAYEVDAVLAEEQPGTVPYVRTWTLEQDVVRLEQAMRAARRDVDYVVLALHWGVPFPWLPPAQSPLADYQRPLAHRLIDGGADLIIGHHAHCMHPVERYKQGVILYSTGNFVFHPYERLPADQRRPGSPYKAKLRTRPWYESAVFRVTLGGDVPRLRLLPIELQPDGEPVVARSDVGRRILNEVEAYSQELDPLVRIDAEGWVHWE